MRRRHLLQSAFGLLPLAACSSPNPVNYTLRPVPGTALGGGPKLVEMRRIGLAGYLDRSELVRNQTDYKLSINGEERWAEPLGGLIARILAEDLNLRLPGTSVFTAAGSISADPEITLELDVQRFDTDASGEVVLLAQVATTRLPGRTRSAAQTVRLAVRPTDASTVAQVAAMSVALGQLADRIIPMLSR